MVTYHTRCCPLSVGRFMTVQLHRLYHARTFGFTVSGCVEDEREKRQRRGIAREGREPHGRTQVGKRQANP